MLVPIFRQALYVLQRSSLNPEPLLRSSLFGAWMQIRCSSGHEAGGGHLQHSPRSAGCSEQGQSVFPLHGTSTSLPPGSCSACARRRDLVHLMRFYASKGKSRKGHGRAEEVSTEGDAEELDLKPYEAGMRKAIDHLRLELSGLRTGRAVPGLIEHLEVPAHGSHQPIRTLGTVVARSPQLLAVTLYNSADGQLVVDAVRSSPLQLQARLEGGEVLVPVPKLTMDMVEKAARVAAQHGEHAKKTLGHDRRGALEAADRVPGGADAKQRAKQEVEQLVNRFKADVEQLVKAKQKDLRDNH